MHHFDQSSELLRVMIRVLIVTDIRLYREGLAEILGRTENLDVVGAAAGQEDALWLLASAAPDVVLLDLGTPQGVAVIGSLRVAAPTVNVVALAVTEVEGEVLACAEVGAAGYVPREASVEELVTVIESVMRGETVCPPRIAATLFRRVAVLSGGRASKPSLLSLTVREREILRFLDRGLSNKEIAKRLGVEVATVKNHVHNILEKLRVHRRGEAAARIREALPTSPERMTSASGQ